jgi:hypothetical protein
MTNIIPFPKLQADTCRLHNRFFELEAQHEPAPQPPTQQTPTPFGWFLIGLALISAARR